MLHHLLGRFDVVQPFFQPALEFLAARNQTESRQGRPRLGLILRERRRAVAVQCGLQAVDKGIPLRPVGELILLLYFVRRQRVEKLLAGFIERIG